MKVIFTTCDTCNPEGKTSGREGRGYIAGDRKRARELGWQRRGGKDLCAECQDERDEKKP